MDHQQNYEYNDPNYGFINSFSGSDNNFIMSDQQLNGKTHVDSQLTPYEATGQTTHYNSESMFHHIPDPMVSQQPQDRYPVSFHHQIEAPQEINVQKESIYSIADPPQVVPVNIIQEELPSQVTEVIPELIASGTSEILNVNEDFVSGSFEGRGLVGKNEGKLVENDEKLLENKEKNNEAEVDSAGTAMEISGSELETPGMEISGQEKQFSENQEQIPMENTEKTIESQEKDSEIQESAQNTSLDTSINLPEPENEVQESSHDTALDDSRNFPEPENPQNLENQQKSQRNPQIFSSEQSNIKRVLSMTRKEALAQVGTTSCRRRRRILQLNEDDSEDENDLKNELETSPEKKTDNAESEDSESDGESSDKDPEAFKARSLLKSAVIIHGPTSKKKKRVLESDEEDEMLTSVDDIGLMETNEPENDEELYNNDIIVDVPFEVTESFEAIENPIIDNVESEKVEDDEKETSQEVEKEEETETNEKVEEKSEKVNEVKKIIKTEDGEIDPSMSVEAILDNIKPMADDDEFFKTFEKKSEDSDNDVIPNEEYFGTPDASKKPTGKKRGPKPGSKRQPRQNTERRKRANKYTKDNFVQDSESDSEDSSYSESSSSSGSSVQEVRRRGRPPKAAPVVMQPKNFTVTRVPIKRKIVRKDRFYDRSRDIPNDVYFGDVKVPLHVLHTRWNSDDEPASAVRSEEPQRMMYTKVHNPLSNLPSSSKLSYVSKEKPSLSYSYIEQTDDPKLSTLKEFVRIAGIKLNYSKLFETVRSTEGKCAIIRRILARKGLPGEPTIAKCKQLRLELQAKRESAELDTSVIIRTEGRTRRAMQTRNSSRASTSGAVVQPETLQTLSKIRRVVDSESE